MSTQRPRQPHHSPKIVNESIRSLVQRIPRNSMPVQGGMSGDARRAARRLAWERLDRSLLSCVS